MNGWEGSWGLQQIFYMAPIFHLSINLYPCPVIALPVIVNGLRWFASEFTCQLLCQWNASTSDTEYLDGSCLCHCHACQRINQADVPSPHPSQGSPELTVTPNTCKPRKHQQTCLANLQLATDVQANPTQPSLDQLNPTYL